MLECESPVRSLSVYSQLLPQVLCGIYTKGNHMLLPEVNEKLEITREKNIILSY